MYSSFLCLADYTQIDLSSYWSTVNVYSSLISRCSSFCSPAYKVKAPHTRYRSSVRPGAVPGVQAASPPGGRLSLLSARPAVTFPAAKHHRPLAGTKLYCLVTEAHRYEQHDQGCYAAFAPSRIWTHDLLIASPTLYSLRRRTTCIRVISRK